jgi:hypothetical protein
MACAKAETIVGVLPEFVKDTHYLLARLEELNLERD